ncbi:MAG: helix-turn-helix transcriptional regulator [Brevundimonas sp.]|nr:helix-turn-helix transcriptional regulator [Brevundimonas sp.]
MQEGTETSPGYPQVTLRGDVFSAQCPTRELLDRIADKWTVLLLTMLERGPSRFNALKREVDGVSQKMLSQTLRQLERDGLVSRSVDASVMPVAVTYALTPLGGTLVTAIQPMIDWAERRITAVRDARRTYDDRQAA